MGQDNKSEEFHQALQSLLSDNDPLVRRNAALQLVRFGDGSGRPELRSMLQSFEAKSAIAGQTIAWLYPDRSTVNDALQALAYVGTRDDLPVIEQCAQASGSAETAQQATAAVKAIKSRLN